MGGLAERAEMVNHEDLEGVKALAFCAFGEDFFEAFVVFVVRFFCLCLNRRAIEVGYEC
jgi:hypothetical protein